MKKLVLITITLFTFSGGVLATASEQQSGGASANDKTPPISFSMIKEAFKFGFQSGWMVEK